MQVEQQFQLRCILITQIWEKYDPEAEAAAAGENAEAEANGTSGGGETLEVVVTEVGQGHKILNSAF